MPQDDLASTIVLKSCNHCRRNYTARLHQCPECNGYLAPCEEDPLPGASLEGGKYSIERLIGVGGMGIVYKGWHELMRRAVAIKVLRPQFIDDENSIQRFKREAQAAGKLKHPNIITLHDFGVTDDGLFYIVMDLLEGHSLTELIRYKGYVGVDRSIKIFSKVCDALQHAHTNGVIHRDLKPGNIIICPTEYDKDFVKLVDFGIAKTISDEDRSSQSLTQNGEVFGSPLYMSPEQCLGRTLDGRSDIYSTGVVLYEALIGHPPFVGQNMISTIDLHIHEPPPRFSQVRPDLYIPERVEAVVLKALSKKPEDRQQTMEQLKLELLMAVPRRTFISNRRVKPRTPWPTYAFITAGLFAAVAIMSFHIALQTQALKLKAHKLSACRKTAQAGIHTTEQQPTPGRH